MDQSTHVVSDQQPATTEQAPQQIPAVDPVAVQAAAADAAAREEQERDQAAATLKAMVKAYRQGERAYRAGLLEAGRLADVYLHQRVALGDQRRVAVQRVEGILADHSSTSVDANRLIATYHAYRLLAVEQGLEKTADAVSYGHYRDHYARLVQRQDKDTAQESWTLLPGVEQQALALYREACQAGLSREAVGEKVAALVREQAALAAKQAEGEAAAQRVEEQKAKQAQQEAAQAREAAERHAAELAEQERATEDGEERARIAAQAEQARQDLLARQRAEAEATALAAEEARKAHAAEQARLEAEKREKAQRDKAQRQADREQRRREQGKDQGQGQPRECQQGQNLLAVGKKGTAKDVARMALELVSGSDQPDDVLEELLRLLDASPCLSRLGKRAVKAARVCFATGGTQRPLTAPALAS
jgi:colicin import membrane protein